MIEAYLDYIPHELLSRLAARATPVAEVPGLAIAPGQREAFPRIESAEALAAVVDVFREVEAHLDRVLRQRVTDRAFLDAATLDCVARNGDRSIQDPDYLTVLGLRDGSGRVVAGPTGEEVRLEPVVVPEFLRGEQVTLFGPPDTPKMAINAMNALHRRRADEPEIVGRLVERSGQTPRWGADDEDSKTPIMHNFLAACENLIGCFEGTLSYDDPVRGKSYRLAESGLARPIKRFPGLALPDGSHLLEGAPLPLHLVDFVLHSFHNRGRPEALVFYVPKLENEEEAAYLSHLLRTTEDRLGLERGTVRVLLVFENPRAIFRIREMARALQPHFLGGSLGWHDFLASTARLFKHDPNYRIPVKADPDIVIRHIKESHLILVRSLQDCGAITIGGMYGVLFEAGNPASYRVSMVGYVRDVVTQLKRGLQGFWVAHPDFVRIGIALVEAWRQAMKSNDDRVLRELVCALVPDPVEQGPLLDFVFGEDVPGLERGDPRYARAVLAADLEASPVIANDDPDELRYNIFQALQYLTDWLGGNGCVALPATLTDQRGQQVFVRIMDDLATTERSRWELWAEVAHGRVPVATFEALLREELAFIREGRVTPTKRADVPWHDTWTPLAADVLRELVTSPDPPEFVSQLTMRYTFDIVRDSL